MLFKLAPASCKSTTHEESTPKQPTNKQMDQVLEHNSKHVRPPKMTLAGLEPAAPGSVGRCLLHWATGPLTMVQALKNGQRSRWASEARLAQSVERKALNLVVVDSSPTVGGFAGPKACPAALSFEMGSRGVKSAVAGAHVAAKPCVCACNMF